jgi:hypothetical protein
MKMYQITGALILAPALLISVFLQSGAANRNSEAREELQSLREQLSAQAVRIERMEQELEKRESELADLQTEHLALREQLESQESDPEAPLFTPEPFTVPVYFRGDRTSLLRGTLFWQVSTNELGQEVWSPLVTLAPQAQELFTRTVTNVVERPVSQAVSQETYVTYNQARYPYPVYYGVAVGVRPKHPTHPVHPTHPTHPTHPFAPVKGTPQVAPQRPPELPRVGLGPERERGFPPRFPRAGIDF